MKRPAVAEIVAVGNELMLGETVDTNSAEIARRLGEIGVRVARTTHVGDDRERLAGALREAAERARWVVVTGGLGPTRDDVTREAVAAAFDRPVDLDPDVLAGIEAKFRDFGYAEMPPSNRSQAEIPAGAEPIPNPRGTAPGLAFREGVTGFWILPGVPAEMRALFEAAVLPAIAGEVGDGTTLVRHRVVHTVGIGESALAEKIDDLVGEADPIEIAFLPDVGQVDVRLTLAGRSADEVDARLDRFAAEIEARLAAWTWGRDGTTLGAAVGEALRSRGWTVAVAESCTAGELGAALTETPGSSDWFVGGVLAYADRVKTAALDVPPELLERHGAVSEEVCRAMIAGARARIGAEVGCAITGVAGPGGGTEEKPVGLVWCGVGTPDETRVRKLAYPGSRADNRRRATLATLGLVLELARVDEAAA